MNEMMDYDVHEKRFSHFQVPFRYIAHFLKGCGLLELFCVSLRKGDGDEEKERREVEMQTR